MGVARLTGVGARLIQLRIKDRDEAGSRARRATALAVCAKAGAVLVVNDFWRVAIDEGAPWVHLGQGDLDDADIRRDPQGRREARRQHAR